MTNQRHAQTYTATKTVIVSNQSLTCILFIADHIQQLPQDVQNVIISRAVVIHVIHRCVNDAMYISGHLLHIQSFLFQSTFSSNIFRTY